MNARDLRAWKGVGIMTIIKDGCEVPEPFRIDDKAVVKALESFEWETICDTGIKNISGGFAKAEIFDLDEDYFDVELKWGVQSDCEDEVHTEQYKMDRLTLLIKD
jgi:hypothetical protein